MKDSLEFLEVSIQKYPAELEGVEIELSIFGTIATAYVDVAFVDDFSDDFVTEWA